MEKMEKKWISDFVGVGYRYTDIIMNILILYSDRKLAIKTWNENIHWWPDDQISLRFIKMEIITGLFSIKMEKTCFQKKTLVSLRRTS